jgi:F420-dependent oxidoreductase-like protein
MDRPSLRAVLVGLQQCTYSWPGGVAALPERLAAIATEAEAVGFSSFWLMDHFHQIPGWGTPENDPMLEVYTALGFVAARTSRIRLGPLVASAVYRYPAVAIKAATTLDVLSGGRAYFGIGAAWFEKEAIALGIPFPPRRERFAALEDLARLARQTWAADPAPFVGKTFTAMAPTQNPLPLSRPRPPILIAGRGPKRTLGLVARYADAWNVIASPAEGPAFLAALHESCAAIGRDVDEIETTVLDPDDWRRQKDPEYAWSEAWELARLREWRSIGFDHVIVNLPDAHDPAKLRRYGEVIAQL